MINWRCISSVSSILVLSPRKCLLHFVYKANELVFYKMQYFTLIIMYVIIEYFNDCYELSPYQFSIVNQIR